MLLASTAAIHRKEDPPFNLDGDLSFRVIPSTTAVDANCAIVNDVFHDGREGTR